MANCDFNLGGNHSLNFEEEEEKMDDFGRSKPLKEEDDEPRVLTSMAKPPSRFQLPIELLEAGEAPMALEGIL
jgi:hypothetical protein